MAWSNIENKRAYHRQYMRDRRDRIIPISIVANLDGEIWKPVPGFAESYASSNLGRVQRVTACRNRRGPHVLSQCCGNISPYPRVTLAVNGTMKTFTVHTLIAASFLGPRPVGMVINHKDGDPTNNAVDNLEYCTQLQNIRHSIAAGRSNPADTAKYQHIRRPIVKRLAQLLTAEQIAWAYDVPEERIRKALR